MRKLSFHVQKRINLRFPMAIVPRLLLHEGLQNVYESHSARRRSAIKEREQVLKLLREDLRKLIHREKPPSRESLASVRSAGPPRKAGAPSMAERVDLDRRRGELALVRSREITAERERVKRENAVITARLKRVTELRAASTQNALLKSRIDYNIADDDIADEDIGDARRTLARVSNKRAHSAERLLAEQNIAYRKRTSESTGAATGDAVADDRNAATGGRRVLAQSRGRVFTRV